MNLPTELFGNVLVVHTPDELCMEHAERFESFFTGVEHPRVVLDVDNTESWDSQGLTAVMNVHDTLRTREGDLKIATSSAINRKIFEITRLDQQLEVYESVVEAVNSFQ
jgi:anti-anti-sigma factor